MKRQSVTIGDVYGELTVLDEPVSTSQGYKRVTCKCSCGNTRTYITYKLYGGKTKSCGHLAHSQEAVQKRTQPKHGFAKRDEKRTGEYNSWGGMKSRCYTKTDKRYHCYGGRGITVCDEWRNSFLAFIDYMGIKPDPSYSLDRIDNNGNYEPGNVRWATPAQQHANQRHRGSPKKVLPEAS